MKKLLLTTLACIFSNLCFANDFNWKVMKNPPTDIKCHWSNAGNAAWIPKDIKTDCFEEYNMTIFLTPQILLKNGKTTIQIIFGNTKAKTEKLGFTYRSNKEMFEIPIVKNNTIKMKGKLFYLAIAEITPSEYIKRFILSYPEFVFFRIPTLIKSPKVRMNGTQCYVWETSFTAMKPLFNIKSEQFEYVLQLPITDNAVCMELWNNQPGTVSKWVIITQSGKRWTLECGEQIPKVVDGTTVYIAQYFFQKAWYLDNLVFDPIVSMEFSVTNKGGTQDYTFALTDKDKTFISQKNASLTSSSPKKNVQTTTMQTAPPTDTIRFMGIPVAMAFSVSAEPIMTNTSLDLKLSLYPAESSKEGAIVFWTNKGEVERWSVTTASGKNYEMAVKSRYVVKQDGITKYMVKSSLNKDIFIKVFKNDLPVSVSFQIKGFANGQYATIDLPQDIKNHFASELANFNRPMALVQKFPPPPAGTIEFMGIPMWGDVGLFAEKLKSKGFKVSWWKNEYSGYTYYCEGSFWRWEKTTCTIYSFDKSREISAIKVVIDGEEVEYAPKSQLKDMLILLKEKYGNGRILDSLNGESYEILRVLWSLKNGGVKFEYTWSRNSWGLKPTLELSYYTPKGLKSVFGETKTDGETNSEL